MIRRARRPCGLLYGRSDAIRYLFTATKRRVNSTDSLIAHQRQEALRKQQQQQLEEKMRQMQAYRQSLETFVKQQRDREAMEAAAEKDKVDMLGVADESDLDTLAGYLESDSHSDESYVHPGQEGLFPKIEKDSSLPPALLSRMGSDIVAMGDEQKWQTLLTTLRSNGGLTGLTNKELDLLLFNIPLEQRIKVLPEIGALASEANIVPSVLTYGHIVAAYAQVGDTQAIDNVLSQMHQQDIKPNKHIYGNLLKALSKNGDLDRSVQTLELMKRQEITPSLEIYTILMQTCLRVKDFKQANEVFDMMKFLSAETQPDLKIYNTMMLSSAFQHNIERVMDLYRELQEPHRKVLATASSSDLQAMYNILIYACSRDERTHLKGWEFLLELQAKDLAINRRSVESLIYLCGNTGEIMLARAMFKQLCQNPLSYPSAMTFNSLLKAYCNFQPGQLFSSILASPLGAKIQANFVFDEMITSSRQMPDNPPFLPLPFLTDKVQVLAESRALMSFFKETHSELINERSILTYLKIPFELQNLSEFKYRYEEMTTGPASTVESLDSALESSFDSAVEVSETTKYSQKIARNHYIYDLAIQAASFTKDMEFGSQIWKERGAWRKTMAFQNLTKADRDHSDFIFAQRMVSLLSNCGEFDDAISLLQSTADQFTWKPFHVSTLSNRLMELDDVVMLRRLRRLLGRNRAQRRQYKEFYQHEEKEQKRNFNSHVI